jgi:hypothetical protein
VTAAGVGVVAGVVVAAAVRNVVEDDDADDDEEEEQTDTNDASPTKVEDVGDNDRREASVDGVVVDNND